MKLFFRLSLAAFLAAAARADDSPFTAIASEYIAEALPLLESHCLDCHDAETRKGELNLERFDSLEEVRQAPEIWQHVVEQIESGEMPPKDKKQLDATQRDTLLAWVKGYLDAEARANAGDPGPVTLRRLSNAEYTYSVRDLTGIDSLDPAREFPVDSAAGEGFTNTGDALVMSPALLEKYFAAGKEIADHAVLLEHGFRFAPDTTRRDWSNAIVERIRSLYLAKLQAPAIDFGYRSGKEVGEVRPASASEGKLEVTPYLEALIVHREALADPGAVESVAEQSGLVTKYLGILAGMMTRDEEQSTLVEELRRRLSSARPGDGAAVAAWLGGWQEALWRFQSVGHLGIIRPWQEPVSPVNDRRDLQVPLQPGDASGTMTVSLVAGGCGSETASVRWEQPRIVRPGKQPVMLRDVRAAAAVFDRYRKETLAGLERSLETAFAARNASEGAPAAVDAILQAKGADPEQMKPLFAWLGIAGFGGRTVIRDPLLGRIEEAAGQTAIQGWTHPGLADLSILGNGSDSTWRIPGEAPPRRVVVHPRPERWIAAGWQSPITGTVRITAHVQDRHVGCGNGVRWSLQQRRGEQRRILRAGDIGTGGTAQIEAVDAFSVQEGDLISIAIDSRDGNHSCDLTEIELAITDLADDGLAWSLAADCASSMLAGNPHPDTHGNPAVWHFFSGLNEDDGKWQAVPEQSLLARWLECTEPEEAAALARQIAVLANGKAPEAPGPDAELHRLLTAADGPLFAHTDFAVLATRASAEEVADSPYGLEPALFDGDGGISTTAPATLAFRVPTGLFGDGAAFAVSAMLAPSGSEAGFAQLQAVAGEVATPPHQWEPGLPVTARPGSEGQSRVLQAFDDFRSLFPAAMCYTRVVPIDEVVTLVLYHREDAHLARLMLTPEEQQELNRLWNELHFVSEDAFQIVTGLEQILEFATQDADPSRFFPLRDPINRKAAALTERLNAAVPAQVDALIDFAARAFRRPVTADEEQSLRSLHATLRQEELPHDEAFRLVLARVFASPAFLYRAEKPARGTNQGPVDDWELATRLSYFLAASTPDHELRQAAASGTLRAPDTLAAHARRLLKDHRARRLAVEFACQWLHVRDFDQFDEKSESRFPEFAGLRGAMYEETIRFFTDLFQRDGSILDILNADHAFVNGTLARFYGIDGDGSGIGDGSPDSWRRVEGIRDIGRGGILAMATTLAKQSGASRTSPILRGNWVSESLLGEKLPKPPPGVPPLPETVPAGLSERELIERHSSEPACAKCHARIDPYGFSLENFDAIGRLRDTAADTRTELPDGTRLDGLDDLRIYLADTRRDTFVRQFCRKLLGYALGRSVRLSDEPLLDAMDAALRANNYRFGTAVDTIVRSRQFREIRGDGQP